MRTPITFFVITLALGAFAQDDCTPPISTAELNINNVRAVITNGLGHFEDDGSAAYQVPKLEPGELGPNSIYADGLWVRGITADGQLRLAATTYPVATASEYSPGPLPLEITSAQDQSFCDLYDQVHRADRTDAELHYEYYNRLEEVAQGADPSILTDPPFENGYTTPEYFYSWPGTNADSQFENLLAPFWDYNQDNIYNPDDGDFPGFDVNGEADCHDPLVGQHYLLGHQATWYVSNDLRTHGISGGEAIGIEVQVMNYAYATDDALNDATFVQYTIINRSVQTLTDCVISKWVDFDIGCGADDYVGTEVARGMIYGFNSDAVDEDCGNTMGYGEQAVAQGVMLLAGPRQNDDGLDNPLTTDLALAESLDGIVYECQGRGYGDGIVDNECLGMRGSVYYSLGTNTPGINGEPNIPSDYYSLMENIWMNGDPVTYGGNGVGGVIETDYMFPGISDPLGVATGGEIVSDNWSEVTENNPAGDRRMIMSTAPFMLDPGEVNVITYGYIWAQDETNDNNALPELFAASDLVDSYFEDCFLEVNSNPSSLSDLMTDAQSLILSPNPATDEVVIRMNTIDADIESVRLYDLSGVQVRAESVFGSESIRIDLHGLADGYYLVEVIGRDGSQISSPLIKK